MLKLTNEQQKAYDYYIKCRDRIRRERIPQSEVLATVDVTGSNHPLFVQNDAWLEYLEASKAWWAVEPKFRNDERLRMTRGDYDSQDSWDDPIESDYKELV